jgi:hypothetical protein
MSFSRKIASYFPRFKLRSQTTMSMTALKLRDWSIALSERAAEVIGLAPEKISKASSAPKQMHRLLSPEP